MKSAEHTSLPSSKIIGKRVENKAGVKIGQIKDLIFSQSEGQITSLVISSGVSLNPAESYVVFPFASLVARYDDGVSLILDTDQQKMETAPLLKNIASHQALPENLFANKSGCFIIDDMQFRHLQLHGHFTGIWGDAAPEGSMNTSNAYSANPDHKDSDAHRGPFPARDDAEGNLVEDGTKDRPMP